MTKILIIVADSRYFLSHRLSLSKYLQDNGYQVHVATNVLNSSDREKICSQGFSLYDLPTRPSGFGLAYSANFIRRIMFLYHSILPQVVLSVSIRISFLTMIAARLKIGPNLYHYSLITGMGFLATSKKLAHSIIRFVVKRLIKLISLSKSFYIIVQNSDDYQEMKKVIHTNRLFIVLGSGVDDQVFFPSERKQDDKIIVSMVSRMLKDKGVEELVNAAKIIKEKGYSNIVIQLVGDTHSFNPNTVSKSYLEKVHDAGYVNWLGSQSDISAIYQNSDISVLPSHREGLPKSLLEAAASGLPIITTDAPGCREICKDGINGILVHVKSPESIADAIIKLANDANLRKKMGLESRLMIERYFSLPKINQQILTILNSYT